MSVRNEKAGYDKTRPIIPHLELCHVPTTKIICQSKVVKMLLIYPDRPFYMSLLVRGGGQNTSERFWFTIYYLQELLILKQGVLWLLFTTRHKTRGTTQCAGFSHHTIIMHVVNFCTFVNFCILVFIPSTNELANKKSDMHDISSTV